MVKKISSSPAIAQLQGNALAKLVQVEIDERERVVADWRRIANGSATISARSPKMIQARVFIRC